MFAAFSYLQWYSFRNRMITRFKRLRQPKYLFGAVVGGLYVYFYFFRYLFNTVGGGSNRSNIFPSEYLPLFETLAALILLIIVTFVWFFPSQRAALTFTEAEVAFLFPAPVSRRMLIHYKIIRSQLRIFFSAFILTFLTRRFGGGGGVLIHACGWWLILSLLDLHILGASFTRTLLLDKGISNWLRRLIVAVVIIGGGVALWPWIEHNVPQISSSDMADKDSFLDYLQRVSDSPPVMCLLYPFRVVAQPFFAANAGEFFAALAPVALLFALHYMWVLYSNVAFEEASLEASQRLATRVAAIRSGNWQQARWQAAGKTRKKRRAWFRLAPTGPPMIALCWKNLLGTGGVITIRLVVVITVIVVFAISTLSHSTGSQDTPEIVGVTVAALLLYSAFLGPQLLRADLRTSLAQADVIKTFPMRGWQIVLGEILASTVLLAGFQWCLLLIGAGTVICLPGHNEALILLLAGTLLFVLPVLDFLLLLVPNASVLLFPSWVTPGKSGPQGIEAAGQRIIMALVQFFAFLLALIPAGLAFCAVYFVMRFVSGPFVPIPFGALAATIIFAIEAAVGVFLLGKVFDKLDLSEEQLN